MDTWTRQMGLPVVNVRLVGEQKIILEQERFLLNPDDTYDPDESPFGWVFVRHECKIFTKWEGVGFGCDKLVPSLTIWALEVRKHW